MEKPIFQTVNFKGLVCHVVFAYKDTCIFIPREKGILFSVCLSGTLFCHFVRLTRTTVFITLHTQTKPTPYESWVSRVCHEGAVFHTLKIPA